MSTFQLKSILEECSVRLYENGHGHSTQIAQGRKQTDISYQLPLRLSQY